LDIPFCQRSLIFSHQRLAHSYVFLPIPKIEVIVQDILAGTRALRFGGIADGIMACPESFWTFEVRGPNSRYEI
jgi:hypothetical protein